MSASSSAGAPQRSVVVLADLHAVARAAADLFTRLAAEAQARGKFTVALSGGSTPRTLHTLLRASPYREQIPWEQIEYYWGDERCVPPDDDESNYKMAHETLLSQVPVQPDQVHRMPAELPDHAAAAAEYEQMLRRTFGLQPGELPRFDLILLGMGPDGHTASLFPHTQALAVRDRLVTANYVPKLNAHRITLTAPVINNAAHVAFLVAGTDKADALAAVLEGVQDPETYPSQMIAPRQGTLFWFVDHAAAAKLQRS